MRLVNTSEENNVTCRLVWEAETDIRRARRPAQARGKNTHGGMRWTVSLTPMQEPSKALTL
jgi:hypothetical protein